MSLRCDGDYQPVANQASWQWDHLDVARVVGAEHTGLLTREVREATELLDLTATEAALLPRLAKGRALWKVGGHTAVVEHVIAPAERRFCDTDARMAIR